MLLSLAPPDVLRGKVSLTVGSINLRPSVESIIRNTFPYKRLVSLHTETGGIQERFYRVSLGTSKYQLTSAAEILTIAISIPFSVRNYVHTWHDKA